jgi:hypothetical protein
VSFGSPSWKPLALLTLALVSPCRAAADEQSDTGSVPLAAAVDSPRVTRTELAVEGAPATVGWRDQVTQLDYRWWAVRGRGAVGFGVGTLAHGVLPLGLARPTAGYVPGETGGPASTLIEVGPVLTVGLRYRTSEHSTFYADAANVRGSAYARDSVVGKVGMEFKSAKSRWAVTYGGLGLHLSGDTRMTLRLRKGGLAVMMRSTF